MNLRKLVALYKKDPKSFGDKLPGGKGDKNTDKDFNSKEVAMGHKVEAEHTNNPKIAAEVTRDHLSERNDYYSKLKDAGLADELEKTVVSEDHGIIYHPDWHFEHLNKRYKGKIKYKGHIVHVHVHEDEDMPHLSHLSYTITDNNQPRGKAISTLHVSDFDPEINRYVSPYINWRVTDEKHQGKGLNTVISEAAIWHNKKLKSDEMVSPGTEHIWTNKLANNPKLKVKLAPQNKYERHTATWVGNQKLKKDAGLADELEKGMNGDWKKEGYKLEHRLAPGDEHVITARASDGDSVGFYTFGTSPNGLFVSNVETHPDHQRKGLANAAYKLAEQKSGKKIHHQTALQSKDAQALWSQPNRPFGKSLEKGLNGDWQKEGYTVKMHGDDPDDLSVRAYDHSGKPVAQALIDHIDNNHIFIPSVKVDAAHQRKGLGSAMYQLAEKHTGKKIIPSEQIPESMKDDQVGKRSEGGKALWSQPNRLFGKSLEKGLKGDWQKEGYVLSHDLDSNNKYITVTAHKDGQKVAELSAGHSSSKPGFLHPTNVKVEPAHQRKGIANAMYQMAEQKLGMPFAKGSSQSQSAKKLWKQPNRPFGKSEDKSSNKTYSHSEVVQSAQKYGNPDIMSDSDFSSRYSPDQKFVIKNIPLTHLYKESETPDKPLHLEGGQEDEKYAQKFAQTHTSSKTHGPIIAHPGSNGRYEIVDGRHRSRASFLRGETHIDAFVPVSEQLDIGKKLNKSMDNNDKNRLKSKSYENGDQLIDTTEHKKMIPEQPYQAMLNDPKPIKGEGIRQFGGISAKAVHKIGEDTFMAKPYHKKIESATKTWCKHPILGWASLATKNLYNSAGIGHLCENVAYGEHNGTPLTVHKFGKGYVDNLSRHEPDNQFDMQARQIATMDYLTNNLDRHGGNILHDNNNKRLLAIDHERSFQYQKSKGYRSSFYATSSRKEGPLGYLNDSALSKYKLNNYPDHNSEAMGEWWSTNKDNIKNSFEKELAHIKDPNIRENLSSNFNKRHETLSDYFESAPDQVFYDYSGIDTPIMKKFLPKQTIKAIMGKIGSLLNNNDPQNGPKQAVMKIDDFLKTKKSEKASNSLISLWKQGINKMSPQEISEYYNSRPYHHNANHSHGASFGLLTHIKETNNTEAMKHLLSNSPIPPYWQEEFDSILKGK